MPDTGLLESYVTVLRGSYCSARNRWHWDNEGVEADWGLNPIPRFDGGVDPQGRRFQSVWEKIARFVIEKQVSPTRFIEAQFRKRVGAPPEPTTLCTDFALKIYSDYEREEVPDLQRLFKFQKAQMHAEYHKLALFINALGWTEAQTYSAILQNTVVSMSALFRYCLAVEKGCTDVADTFRTEASIQYLSSPKAYDEVWEGLIPEELRRLSRLSPEQLATVTPEEVEGPPVRRTRTLIVD